MPIPEPRPDDLPADLHPVRYVLALLVVLLVLTVADACLSTVQEWRNSYLGEGLQR